jgi:hypothetical protein
MLLELVLGCALGNRSSNGLEESQVQAPQGELPLGWQPTARGPAGSQSKIPSSDLGAFVALCEGTPGPTPTAKGRGGGMTSVSSAAGSRIGREASRPGPDGAGPSAVPDRNILTRSHRGTKSM